eukprot:NODE_118_length_18907_cov_0.436251.p10 type:complete len:111 gc:universal NODE_118_length_18907_cov_0.436251:376-708(+)
MDHLAKTWSMHQQVSESFDPNMENYEYIEQVLQYIQLGRFDNKQLENVMPLYHKYTADSSRVPNSENIFIGLCAAFSVKPDHFLAYLSGRTVEDIEQARQYAIHFLSKME